MKSRAMMNGDENKRIAQLEEALMLMVYSLYHNHDVKSIYKY